MSYTTGTGDNPNSEHYDIPLFRRHNMEAKDTVMSEKQLKEKLGDNIIVGERAEKVLELQAEVSFKAGYKQRQAEELQQGKAEKQAEKE